MGDWSTGRWVGEAPHYTSPTPPGAPPPALACGACGAADTDCVHAWSSGSIVGYVREVEVRCRACGSYTAVEEAYDS